MCILTLWYSKAAEPCGGRRRCLIPFLSRKFVFSRTVWSLFKARDQFFHVHLTFDWSHRPFRTSFEPFCSLPMLWYYTRRLAQWACIDGGFPPARTPPNNRDALVSADPPTRTKTATWSELLCSMSPVLRSTLFLGLGLGIAQQASGSEAAVYYSPSVLDDAG